MINQKKYWEKKIVRWEKTIYQKQEIKNQPLLEKIASNFREILKKRMEVGELILSKQIKSKVVVDLGCGSGIFAINLLKYKPKKIIGVDIASNAIKAAKLKIKSSSLNKQLNFVCSDVRNNSELLQKADIIVGIGFIDYFNQSELFSLFRSIKRKKFLFSFPEKILSIREILQKIYLFVAGCPGAYKYSKEEMNNILKMSGIIEWWYYDKNNIRFITNLPQEK